MTLKDARECAYDRVEDACVTVLWLNPGPLRQRR
jgi:hypothetical protein